MSLQAFEIVYKTPYEQVLALFEFEADLADGETIIGTPTITTEPAGEVTVEDIIISGTAVQAKYVGGDVNTSYHVTCKAITSLGQKKEACGMLKVEEC